MQKRIASIYILMLWNVLSVTSVYADLNGTYDFEADTAYISEILLTSYDGKRSDRLLKVDFKNKNLKVIDEEGKFISSINLDYSRRYLAYSKKFNNNSDSRKVIIYDLQDEEVLYQSGSMMNGHVRWSMEGLILSYGDGKTVYEINALTEDLQSADHKGKRIYIVDWSKDCDCFLYQMSPIDAGSGDSLPLAPEYSKVYELKDGQLVESKKITDLTISDNKKYRFEFYGQEDGNFYRFFKIDGKEPIYEIEKDYMSSGTTIAWYEDVLRQYRGNLRIDFDNLKAVEEKKNGIDFAADRKGYILRWNQTNETRKFFEVEDIRTGKVIKTYEKFWSDEGNKAQGKTISEKP